MRIIDQVDLTELQYTTSKDVIKESLSRIFWLWFESHKNDKVTKISILRGLWKKTIYVRDLKPAFILLFGER